MDFDIYIYIYPSICSWRLLIIVGLSQFKWDIRNIPHKNGWIMLNPSCTGLELAHGAQLVWWFQLPVSALRREGVVQRVSGVPQHLGQVWSIVFSHSSVLIYSPHVALRYPPHSWKLDGLHISWWVIYIIEYQCISLYRAYHPISQNLVISGHFTRTPRTQPSPFLKKKLHPGGLPCESLRLRDVATRSGLHRGVLHHRPLGQPGARHTEMKPSKISWKVELLRTAQPECGFGDRSIMCILLREADQTSTRKASVT